MNLEARRYAKSLPNRLNILNARSELSAATTTISNLRFLYL